MAPSLTLQPSSFPVQPFRSLPLSRRVKPLSSSKSCAPAAPSDNASAARAAPTTPTIPRWLMAVLLVGLSVILPGLFANGRARLRPSRHFAAKPARREPRPPHSLQFRDAGAVVEQILRPA